MLGDVEHFHIKRPAQATPRTATSNSFRHCALPTSSLQVVTAGSRLPHAPFHKQFLNHLSNYRGGSNQPNCITMEAGCAILHMHLQAASGTRAGNSTPPLASLPHHHSKHIGQLIIPAIQMCGAEAHHGCVTTEQLEAWPTIKARRCNANHAASARRSHSSSLERWQWCARHVCGSGG